MKKGIALVIGIIGIALYFLCINKDIIKHNAQEVTMEQIAEEVRSQKPVKNQELPEPARQSAEITPSVSQDTAKETALIEKIETETVLKAVETLTCYFDNAEQAFALTAEEFINSELLPLSQDGILFSPEVLELVRQKRRFDQLFPEIDGKLNYIVRELAVITHRQLKEWIFYELKLRTAYGENSGSGEGKIVQLVIKPKENGEIVVLDFFLEEWMLRGGDGKEFQLYEQCQKSSGQDYELLKNMNYEEKYQKLKK